MLGAQERSPQAETLKAHMHVQILVIPAEVGVQKTARVEHVTITALRTTRVSPPLHYNRIVSMLAKGLHERLGTTPDCRDYMRRLLGQSI